MRNVCLIPARSGSKGLKNKNMAYLNGKPVLKHTIDAAIGSGIFELADIYLSTDSKEYIEHLGNIGVTMLHRDGELASDYSTTADVVLDFLNRFEEDVNLILLQPTSPLRTAEQIKEAFVMFKSSDFEKNIVSVSEIDKSPNLFTELSSDGILKDIIGVDKGYRRQNHGKLYAPNGAIFMTTSERYKKSKSFFTEATIAYQMDKRSSIDIDTYEDYVNAIGSIFFDYSRRERENKKLYETRFKSNIKSGTSKIILGDSRTEPLQIEGFNNLSMGGVTTITVLELVKIYLRPEEVEEVIINLGVNDIIVGYSEAERKRAISDLIGYFSNSRITVCNVFPTLYRPNIDNDLIVDINNYISKMSNVNLIDMYATFEINRNLNFKYTSDGLHLTEEGIDILNEKICSKLNS